MSAPRLQRLDHVSLNVADRARSLAWYRDVLGLAPGEEPQEDDEPVFLGEPGACFALFQSQVQSPARAPESTGLRHVALALATAAELDDAERHLRDLGVAFRPEDHGNARSLYLGDPDGNVVELTTYDVQLDGAVRRA
jgi:catechol-2,3-dioxygenase